MVRLTTVRGPLAMVGRMLVGDKTAGRAASMMGAVAAGTSFMPGLLPRHRRDQVILTGVASALQHGLVMNAQARHHVVARLICTWAGRQSEPGTVRLVEGAVAAGTTATGLALVAWLPQDARERVEVKILTTLGLRLSRVGVASLVVAAADAVDERFGRRSATVRVVAPAAGFLVGSAIAANFVRRFRSYDPVIAARSERAADPLTGRRVQEDGRQEPRNTSVPVSLGLGLLLAGALNVVGGVEGELSGWVAYGIKRVLPGSEPYATATGHAVALTAYLGVLVAGVVYVYHQAEAGGSAIDAAYRTAPTAPTVSGGPRSGIDWQTLSREGVRFVAMSLAREEIAAVTGTPVADVREPIRCFAGVESARTVGARIGLVMEDLERLGAFERSVICLTSPTGTGYVNYVAVETMEYLTRGDCATVGLQYSLRPSFLSLDRVGMAREQNLALLNALVWRIRGLPKGRRPRLVGFGESLGAQTLQSCFLHEGSAGLRRVRMDGALFLGTPAGSRWARDWRERPDLEDPDGLVVEVSGVDEWRAATAGRDVRPRYVLLSNPDDPVPKFSPLLAVARPDWLPARGPRPPGVPHTAVWMPYVTMLVTLIDVINALDFVPGIFLGRGHDYRASVARMVSEVYRLPVAEEEMTRIEYALRDREKVWAERRMLAEQMARAGGAVGRQLRKVGEISSPPVQPMQPSQPVQTAQTAKTAETAGRAG